MQSNHRIFNPKLAIRLGAFAFFLASSTTAQSGIVLDSLPYTQNFNDSSYESSIEDQNLVWVNAGATHTWVESGGWGGGGAAKFTPPILDEGYSGLGQIHFRPDANGDYPTHVNVRFLIYHGSSWVEYANNNKVIIMNRPPYQRDVDRLSDSLLDRILTDFAPSTGKRHTFTSREDLARNSGDDAGDVFMRSMIISHQHDDHVAYGNCDNIVCMYNVNHDNPEPWWPDGNDQFRIGDPAIGVNANGQDWEQIEEQWVSVEFEVDTVEGYIRTYVYTQSGRIAGEILTRQMAYPGSSFKYIDILGGYMQRAVQADPDNYFMISHLVIDDSYIGPPAGFVGGTNPTPTPTPDPDPTPEPLPRNSYTILNPGLVSGGVISLVDNNTITAGDRTLHLDRYETGTFWSGSGIRQGDVVSGTGPFEFGSDADATDMPAHLSLAGTQFAVPHNRYGHQYYMVAQEGDANVTVSLDGVPNQVHLQRGVPEYFDGGINNHISAVITSADTPIMVTHRGDPQDKSWYSDAYPVPPAARELWGFRSANAVFAAVEDNTFVQMYASDGSVGYATLNAGEKGYVHIGNRSGQGQGAAIHLVANRPINAVQYADSDGSEQTAFYPTALLKRRYGLPRAAQYVAVACPEPGTTVTLHNGSAPPVEKNCNANGNRPGKAYFGSSSNGVHIQFGAYLESNNPIHVIYESAKSNDEHNLIGANGGTSASPLFSADMEGASPARDWMDAHTVGADGSTITFPSDGDSQVAQFNYQAGALNDVWLRHNFGSHATVNGSPVDELWINFEYLVSDLSIFNPNPGRESKILLVNWGNPDTGRRVFQVILGAVQDAGSHKFSLEWTKLNRNGSWSGVSSWLTDFSSVAIPENEKLYLQLHIRNSTNGQADGVVQLFNNGELIMERRNVALNDSYGDHPDHFILSPYITDANGLADGYTQYDNVSLYDTDPGPFTRP